MLSLSYKDPGCPRGRKREAGARPARSRHCKQEMVFHAPLGSYRGRRKIRVSQFDSARKSGDLPRMVDFTALRRTGGLQMIFPYLVSKSTCEVLVDPGSRVFSWE